MLKKLGIFALLVMAVAIFNYQLEEDELKIVPTNEAVKQETDYFAHNVTRQLFDKEGKRTQQLTAKQAYHYPQQKILRLKHPKLINENQDNPWQISSVSGVMYEPNSNIELKQQVVLTSMEDNHKEQGKLFTDYLFYYPQEQVGETEEIINIVYKNLAITATGMRAELKSQIIYFKHGVTSRYVPNH